MRHLQGIGFAIHRSRVRVLSGHHQVVASGKLLSLSYNGVPLLPSSIIWYLPRDSDAVRLGTWEDNREAGRN